MNPSHVEWLQYSVVFLVCTNVLSLGITAYCVLWLRRVYDPPRMTVTQKQQDQFVSRIEQQGGRIGIL